MRALGAERGDVSTGSGDLGRRAAGQFAHGERCLTLRRRSGEASDINSQIPALTVVELVGEGWHVGALDAQAEGVVEIVKAQPIQARGVAQIGWRRLQTDAGRPVAEAAIAMAYRAVLGVERRTTLRVRSQQRRQRHLVKIGQARAQLPGSAGDFLTGPALGNGLAQLGHALLQLGTPCLGRQGDDQPLQHIEKFQLLLVFASVDDLATRDGGRVVSADVANQVQRLGGAIQRLANGNKAEAGQQRQHQPGKGETKADH